MKQMNWFLAGVVLLSVLTGAASATVLKRLTLGEIEGYASEVFRGTVLSVTCVEDDGPRKLIWTEVTFTDLSSLKGSFKNATVKYRFAGGTVGKRTLRVIGVPTFAPGQKCFLFTNADLDAICPAIGMGQGRYLLREDDKKVLRLHDSGGKPVYGIEDGIPVRTPAKKNARPMLASAFEKHVRELIARAEAARKKQAEAEKARADAAGVKR